MKERKIYIPILLILLTIFELYISFYSVNKGASNTDEFCILLQTKFQKELLTIDVFNMIRIVYFSIFKSVSITGFRYAKLTLSLLTFILSILVLIPFIKEKYKTSDIKLFLIAYILLTSSITTVFYRSLHYNDLMDYFSIWCLMIIIQFTKDKNNSILCYFLTIIYSCAVFFLIGTKFTLGIFAIIAYIITILFYYNKPTIQKIINLFLLFITFAIIISIYINHFYSTYHTWLKEFSIVMKHLRDYRFPVYEFDVIFFIMLSFLLFMFHQHKLLFLNELISKITKLRFFIFILIIQLLLLISLLSKNKISYVFYFLIPSLLFILISHYQYSYFIRDLILNYNKEKIKDKTTFIIIVTSLFLLFILFGSLTLQLINTTLHLFPLAILLIVMTLYLNKPYPLYSFGILCFISFLCFNIFNPFLFSNNTLLGQKKLYTSNATNESFYVDNESFMYFNSVNQFLDKYKNKYVLNIDYSNIVYMNYLLPYVVAQTVDEEEPEIYQNGLHLISTYKKPTYKPELLFISKPVDPKYFEITKNECHVQIGKMLFSIKDPSANWFKFMKSDGKLYIYELLPE